MSRRSNGISSGGFCASDCVNSRKSSSDADHFFDSKRNFHCANDGFLET